MYRSLIAMTLVVAPLCVANAQSAVPDSGARIRITTAADARAKNGTLISMTPDTVVYHPEFMLSVMRTPLDSVRGIERSNGRKVNVHDMFVDAGLGGLIGLGVSSLVLFAPSQKGDGPPAAVGFVILAPLLVTGGIVAGGWIGAEHRTESWSRLYPDIADASMIVGPNGHYSVAFGISVPYDVPMSIDDDVPSDSIGQSAEP